jgi:hypothetical protein
VLAALKEAEANAIKERATLYAALEDAQTQRVRESNANTEMARANRSLSAALAKYVAAGDVWGRDHVCTGHIGGVRREKSAEADLALMGARDAARAALAAGFSTPSGAP